MVRRKTKVNAYQDVESFQANICLKVLASISESDFIILVAIRSIVELHIAFIWDVPKDDEMEEDEQAPMKEVFGSLLLGDFSFGIIEYCIIIIITVHVLQEVLRCISLDIQI